MLPCAPHIVSVENHKRLEKHVFLKCFVCLCNSKGRVIEREIERNRLLVYSSNDCRSADKNSIWVYNMCGRIPHACAIFYCFSRSIAVSWSRNGTAKTPLWNSRVISSNFCCDTSPAPQIYFLSFYYHFLMTKGIQSKHGLNVTEYT